LYLPCSLSSSEYRAEIADCLSSVENILMLGGNVVLVGDMNFECRNSCIGYRDCNDLFSKFSIHNCDEFLPECTVTYRNDSLGQSSFIDHMFVSDWMRQFIVKASVLESGCNLSDHLPLVFDFKLGRCLNNVSGPCKSRPRASYCWRFDKSDLQLYYETTREALSQLPDYSYLEHCQPGCDDCHHRRNINVLYDSLVCAMQCAASRCIVRIPCNSLKPYWNEELDRFKKDSIFWHNLWVSAGKPSSGFISQTRL
jgi:hypothetical protein